MLEDTSPFGGATDAPVSDFWWCLLWASKPEWTTLFTLGRGIGDVCSLRFTSGATPAELLVAELLLSHEPAQLCCFINSPLAGLGASPVPVPFTKIISISCIFSKILGKKPVSWRPLSKGSCPTKSIPKFFLVSSYNMIIINHLSSANKYHVTYHRVPCWVPTPDAPLDPTDI